MSFTFNNLRRIFDFGSKGGYAYHTNDLKNTIEGANYFGAVAEMLNEGDLILVAGDLDGTPFHSSYTVSSNDGTTVVLTEASSVTQNVLQVLTVRVAVLGTASNHYVASPVAGSLIAAYGVSNGANGTAPSTIGINIDGVDKATLSFGSSYSAGTGVSDTTVDSNTLSAGEVITIDNNGEGDGTGEAIVTLVIQPS